MSDKSDQALTKVDSFQLKGVQKVNDEEQKTEL